MHAKLIALLKAALVTAEVKDLGSEIGLEIGKESFVLFYKDNNKVGLRHNDGKVPDAATLGKIKAAVVEVRGY